MWIWYIYIYIYKIYMCMYAQLMQDWLFGQDQEFISFFAGPLY